MTTRRRGRPRRSEAERAERRNRLVDATIDAVRTHGSDVSIDRIASVAGVSKPVLYKTFGDRTGLADAVAVTVARRFETEVVSELTTGTTIDVDRGIEVIVAGLINLIDNEPEIYGYLVRSIRTSDRGILDNAIVRIIQDRYSLLVGLVAPGAPPDQLAVLTDGLFGFVFAAVESWQIRRVPAKETLIASLVAVIRSGIAAAAALDTPD